MASETYHGSEESQNLEKETQEVSLAFGVHFFPRSTSEAEENIWQTQKNRVYLTKTHAQGLLKNTTQTPEALGWNSRKKVSPASNYLYSWLG